MTKYKHIFFDLDHTLWDYDRNAAETLFELHEDSNLGSQFPNLTPSALVTSFNKANRFVWDLYNLGNLSKEQLREQRFRLVLSDFEIEDRELARFFELGFLKICPLKSYTFAYTHETLSYLSKKYSLHIITNGFDETQTLKLQASNIHMYFDQIITSETTGFRKPDSGIFEYALKMAGANVNNSLMIGDNVESDIKGARSMGIDQVLFDPDSRFSEAESTFKISCLSELKAIF